MDKYLRKSFEPFLALTAEGEPNLDARELVSLLFYSQAPFCTALSITEDDAYDFALTLDQTSRPYALKQAFRYFLRLLEYYAYSEKNFVKASEVIRKLHSRVKLQKLDISKMPLISLKIIFEVRAYSYRHSLNKVEITKEINDMVLDPLEKVLTRLGDQIPLVDLTYAIDIHQTMARDIASQGAKLNHYNRAAELRQQAEELSKKQAADVDDQKR